MVVILNRPIGESCWREFEPMFNKGQCGREFMLARLQAGEKRLVGLSKIRVKSILVAQTWVAELLRNVREGAPCRQGI